MYCRIQRRVMAAELAPSHPENTACTEKKFRVRQIGVDNPRKKKHSGPPGLLDIDRSAETQSCKI